MVCDDERQQPLVGDAQADSSEFVEEPFSRILQRESQLRELVLRGRAEEEPSRFEVDDGLEAFGFELIGRAAARIEESVVVLAIVEAVQRVDPLNLLGDGRVGFSRARRPGWPG